MTLFTGKWSFRYVAMVFRHFLNARRTVFLISSDANLVQNFSLKKIQDIMQEFQDTIEISGHSGQILKFQEFQEFQDNAQA